MTDKQTLYVMTDHDSIAAISQDALDQGCYLSEKSAFFNLYKEKNRPYIKAIAAHVNDNGVDRPRVNGLAIIWDFSTRSVADGLIDSREKIIASGLIDYAIVVYVRDDMRRDGIGQLVANTAMTKFNQRVFCFSDTDEQMDFWTSPYMNRKHLALIFSQRKGHITFLLREGEEPPEGSE